MEVSKIILFLLFKKQYLGTYLYQQMEKALLAVFPCNSLHTGHFQLFLLLWQFPLLLILTRVNCKFVEITLAKAGSCRLFRKDILRVRGGEVLFVNIFFLSQNFLSLNDSEELSFLKCDTVIRNNYWFWVIFFIWIVIISVFIINLRNKWNYQLYILLIIWFSIFVDYLKFLQRPL